jgi:hypothetical protein
VYLRHTVVPDEKEKAWNVQIHSALGKSTIFSPIIFHCERNFFCIGYDKSCFPERPTKAQQA